MNALPQYDLQEEQMGKPSPLNMVTEAILDMADRKGSSMQAIKRYCQEKYGLDYDQGDDKKQLTNALRNGVARGLIIQDKGSYRIGAAEGMSVPQMDSPKKKKKKDGSGKRRGPGGLTKPMILSDELAAVCGGNRMGRTDVMKNLWIYIKQNELQDPSNKRNILCDEKLQKLFNETSVNMFTMAKYISAHLTKPEDVGEGDVPQDHHQQGAMGLEHQQDQLGEDPNAYQQQDFQQ